MSEQDKEQRTEDPTAKQIQKFREEGDIAKSNDIVAVVGLLSAVAGIVVSWPLISQSLAGFAGTTLARLDSSDGLSRFGPLGIKAVAVSVLPVALIVMVFTVTALVSQTGWNWTLKPLVPKFSKLNPLPKLKSILFSVNALIEVIKALLKIVLVGFLSVRILLEELENHGRLAGMSPMALFVKLGEIALRIILHASAVLIALAVLDYLLVRYQHKQKMKMTKESVKQERKDQDGDPIVKRRIRKKQYEMAHQRMMQSLSSANVVVVNPNHYSVAIRYRMAQDAAPTIVAVGVDNLALKIREKARHEGIPVVSNAPLARGLYKDGKLGASIPQQYYKAVAELLAWVFNITGRTA